MYNLGIKLKECAHKSHMLFLLRESLGNSIFESKSLGKGNRIPVNEMTIGGTCLNFGNFDFKGGNHFPFTKPLTRVFHHTKHYKMWKTFSKSNRG